MPCCSISVIIIYYEFFFFTRFCRVYDVNALWSNNKQKPGQAHKTKTGFYCERLGIVKKNLHISSCTFILDFESNSIRRLCHSPNFVCKCTKSCVFLELLQRDSSMKLWSMRWETSFNGPASFYCANCVARESFLIWTGGVGRRLRWQRITSWMLCLALSK